MSIPPFPPSGGPRPAGPPRRLRPLPREADAEASPHTHGPGEGHEGGPEVTFHTTFPAPGIYKMWGQFQRGGEILTAPFVVQVQGTRGENP